jgi:hypothetical protein
MEDKVRLTSFVRVAVVVDINKETNKEKFRRQLREAAAREKEALEASAGEGGLDANGNAGGTGGAGAAEAEEMSFKKLTERMVTSIGTADPIADFNSMISRRDVDLVETGKSSCCDISSRLLQLH